MQSFCHTAAYPKPVDVKMHHELPDFISNRGGISLRPGDGIIHSWLNRMLLPDTVGTGGDSHTRFPIGISFPAGSGLVAFGAATGVMPLDMPESVLVRFKGKLQPGVTLRDLVNAIPLYAIRAGLLTVAKQGKKNIFSGRILEIEGLPDLKVEQAFELSDASAERSAAGCTVHLDKAPIIEYINSNITMLKWMIASGYSDVRTIERRIKAMEAWLADPVLMKADADAEYAAVIEIDLADVHEPIVACPNDPDDVKTLSDVAGATIDEVFIGSCMTNIGHFRAASKLLENKRDIPVKLWMAPPTKMDAQAADRRGPLRRAGQCRCPDGDAWLQPVHGQPGTGEGRRNGVQHLDAQLPQSAGQELQRLPGVGRTRGDLLQAWTYSDQGGIHGRHGRSDGGQRIDLSVPEFRPHRDLHGCGGRCERRGDSGLTR